MPPTWPLFLFGSCFTWTNQQCRLVTSVRKWSLKIEGQKGTVVQETNWISYLFISDQSLIWGNCVVNIFNTFLYPSHLLAKKAKNKAKQKTTEYLQAVLESSIYSRPVMDKILSRSKFTFLLFSPSDLSIIYKAW